MSNNTSILENSILYVGIVLEPIFYNPPVELFRNIGYKIEENDNNIINGINKIITDTKPTYEALKGLIVDITPLILDFDIGKLKEKKEKVTSLVEKLKEIINSIKGIFEFLKENFELFKHLDINDFIKKLVDYLICYFLENYASQKYGLFRYINAALYLFSIFTVREEKIIDVKTGQTIEDEKYDLYDIRWEYLTFWKENWWETVKNGFRSEYEWESKNLNIDLVFANLWTFVALCNIKGGIYNNDKEFRIALFNSNEEIDNENYYEGGIHVYPISELIENNNVKGLEIISYFIGELNGVLELSDSYNLELKNNMKIDGYGLKIIPTRDIEIIKKVVQLKDIIDLQIKIVPKDFNDENNEIILLGSKDASYFSLNKFSFTISLKKSTNENKFDVELKIGEINITINAAEGDGFIKKILPKEPFSLKGELTLGYSNKKGFYIAGGAGFEYTIYLNKEYGPIFINTIYLNLDIIEGGITLNTTISGGVSIGPISAVVQKIGLYSELEFGNQSLSKFSIGFKPPSGVGVSIDAGAVKGGGYLSIEKPNYMGMIDLSIQNKIALTAYGILTTELPDGKDGYSLIFSILAKFTPIQLGYGFALKGVGGVIGIHRCMMEEPLRRVVKDHSLDLILFPENPITDAIRILTAIQEIFPPKENYYVFGVMVNIIWGGVIELVSFSLGIIIEIGGGGKLAILGLAKATLPNPQAPIVVLNMDVLGFIDFEAKTLKIDASIFDSKILNFSLSGEMALRANWGENPDFALSVGGFHPRYTPPAGFPALQRLMLSIGGGDCKLDFSTYLAITTNTLQIGAAVNLLLKKGKFTITGGAGFDALFIFHPFSFDIGIFIWVKIAYGSKNLLNMSIDMILTGPNPFRARGKVEFSLLFISLSFPFDKTFGDSQQENLVVESPLQMLKRELEKRSNVSYESPVWLSEGILFTSDAEDKLNPLGAIIINQSIVPLKTNIDLFGGTTPAEGERYFEVKPSLQTGIVTDSYQNFAPAQFIQMTNEQKLSSKPFDSFPAGIKFNFGYDDSGNDISISQEFETILCDSDECIARDNKPKREIINEKQFPNDFDKIQKHSTTYGSELYHSPNVMIYDEKNPNYIKVKESTYTITSDDAKDNKFNRSDKKMYTYTEAFIELTKSKGKGTSIVDSSFSK